MWPLKTSFFLTVYTLACAVSLANPLVGLVNYMLVYQVAPGQEWWSKPIEFLGLRYSLTAAICLLIGMVVSAASLPKARGITATWIVLLVAFNLVVIGSPWVGAGATDYGWLLIDKMLKMSVFLFCLWRITASPRSFRVVLWTLVIGTLLIGYRALTASEDAFRGGRLNLIGAADFRESSGLAAHMSAMIPLIGAVFLTTRRWPLRILAGGAGILAVNTIIQCRTRSAFVGLLVGFAVAVVLAPGRRRLKLWGTLAVLVLGTVRLADDHFWERVTTTFETSAYQEDATIQARLELWRVAGEMFSEHPFGVGVGQYRRQMGTYDTGDFEYAFNMPRRVTHNSYLLCATELGIQGIAVFGAILLLAAVDLRRCRQIAARQPHGTELSLLSYGCLLSLVVYLVSAAFTDRLYTESFWWVIALPTCLRRSFEPLRAAEAAAVTGAAGVTPAPLRASANKEIDQASPEAEPTRGSLPASVDAPEINVSPKTGVLAVPTWREVVANLALRVAAAAEVRASQPPGRSVVADGTWIEDIETGLGRTARADSVVIVDYRMTHASGDILEERFGERIDLAEAMPSIAAGVARMREAGRRIIRIQPVMTDKTSPAGSDEVDEPLVVEVTLLGVEETARSRERSPSGRRVSAGGGTNEKG